MEIGEPRTGILILVVAAVIASGTAGYLWLGQAQPNQEYTGTVEKITVANTEEYSTLIWIAEEQGYFTTNGLDITNIDYQAGKLAADALLAGEADISISAEFVFVSNSFDNADLRTLGTVDTVENLELVARKDSGIADPSDLKGKTIGITRKSVGEFFLGRFLIFHDLSLADVEVVDLTPKEIVAAISNGDIDAGLVWQPSVFSMKNALGDNAISWSGQSGERYNMILIARETFIRDNTEAIDRFIKSIVQAAEFVEANNDEAKSFIAEKYHYESAYMDAIWPQHDFVVELSQHLILTMENQARWRIQNNLTEATKVPNYLDYVYTGALEKLMPNAVSIIR